MIHNSSRETIAFLKEKIFKKKSDLDQDLEFKKINADRDAMLAKAVDALSRERSLKKKLNLFPNHTWKKKNFSVKSSRTIPKAAKLLL